ncbi:MAG TPA: four helix bundle protein [Chitinophagaceae bacterium]|nr:four helix bundle protein [Chitinophagaceae bacterium]
MEKPNLIVDLSFEFALSLIKLYKELVENREFVISKQLLKSGTSVGANIEEAVAAQSRKDFISKMSIALKEARETRYWLRLLDRSQLVKQNYKEYLSKIDSIINVLVKIIKSSKNGKNDDAL